MTAELLVYSVLLPALVDSIRSDHHWIHIVVAETSSGLEVATRPSLKHVVCHERFAGQAQHNLTAPLMVRHTIQNALNDVGRIVGLQVAKSDLGLIARRIAGVVLQRIERQGPSIDVLRILAFDDFTSPRHTSAEGSWDRPQER